MRKSPAFAGRRRVASRLLLIVLGAGALCAIYLVANHYLHLERVAQREALLRGFLDEHPAFSFLLCFALYTVVSFVPGTTGKSLIVGWLFGFWQALIIVNLALTVAAIGSLALGRYFLRDLVMRRWGRFVKVADRELSRDGGFYVLLLRILHAPYTIVNYSLGATSIRPGTFWWSTQIGMLPGNVLFVYAGAQVPSLGHISEHGIWSLLTAELLVAFALLTVGSFAIRWLVRRVWPRRVEVPAAAEGGQSAKGSSAAND